MTKIPSTTIVTVLLEEYRLIREELLERTKQRDQIVFASITLFGAMWGFCATSTAGTWPGLSKKAYEVVLAVAPFLSLLLTAMWATFELRAVSLIEAARNVRIALATYATKDDADQDLPALLMHGLRASPDLSIKRRRLDSAVGATAMIGPGLFAVIMRIVVGTPLSWYDFANIGALALASYTITICAKIRTHHLPKRNQ